MRESRFRRKRIYPLASFALCLLTLAAPSPGQQADPFYLKSLAAGEVQFASGDFAGAVFSLEIAAFGLLKDRPNLLKALGYLCVAAYKGGQYQKSREAAARIATLAGGSTEIGLEPGAAADFVRLAAYYKENPNPSERETAVLSRVLMSPPSRVKEKPAPPQETAPAAASDQARERSLLKAMDKDPRNPELYLELHTLQVKLKRGGAADKTLARMVEKIPDNLQGRFLLGKSLYARKKFKDAAKHLETVLILAPDTAEGRAQAATSLGYLILALNFSGRKAELKARSLEFLAMRPDGDVGGLDMSDAEKKLLGNVLKAHIGPEATEEAVAPAITTDAGAVVRAPDPAPPQPAGPDVAEAAARSYGVYDQYLQENNPAAARRVLESLLRDHPAEARARFLLAVLDFRENKYGDAQDGFQAVLEESWKDQRLATFQSEAAAYLVLCVEKNRGPEAAGSLARAYRRYLADPALEGLSLEGSEKQRIRDYLGSLPAGGPPGRILKDITINTASEELRIEVLYEPPTTYRTFVLPNDAKIVLDLFNVAVIRAARIIPVNFLNVVSVRVGMYERDVGRVVLDIRGDIPPYRIQETAAGILIIVGKIPAGRELF